jgi:S1-C subfamily serine protease
MEHLTKQQIVLVTLLVSFVTSIATGIVTVSLIEQAPTGVTQTIDRVVERTVEKVVPAPTDGKSQSASAVVSLSVDDAVEQASTKIKKSLVKIVLKNDSNRAGRMTGLGIVVSSDGVIITDKSVTALFGEYFAVLGNGTEIPLTVLPGKRGDEFAFLSPTNTKMPSSVIPVSIAAPGSLQLGKAVLSLGGTSSLVLSQGMIESLETGEASSTVSSIATTIPSGKVVAGSPLFTLYGQILGIRTSSLSGLLSTSFYPFGQVGNNVPSLTER